MTKNLFPFEQNRTIKERDFFFVILFSIKYGTKGYKIINLFFPNGQVPGEVVFLKNSSQKNENDFKI